MAVIEEFLEDFDEVLRDPKEVLVFLMEVLEVQEFCWSLGRF